ncbi:MAG: hypothetical protein AB7Y46_11455 [Armatimonadota bacterium]
MPDARGSDERFAYALVSAVPLQDSDAIGIGIIFKAPDRSTLRTLCRAAHDTDATTAAYEAVMTVLDEALASGVGRPTIYLDNADVVRQLTGQEPAPRELWPLNLRIRAMINQVGRPQLVAANAAMRFSARRLAAAADPGSPNVRRFEPRQLSLLSVDAVV